MVETRYPQDRTDTPVDAAGALWRDPERRPDERVDDLLAQLTLAEKVGQLGSRWALNDMTAADGAEGAEGADDADGTAGAGAAPDRAGDGLDPDEVLNVAPMQDVFAASGTISLEDAAAHGLGHLTRVYGSVPITPAGGAAEVMKQQRVVIDRSRLGIPAIVHEECLTGFTAFGATVYPAAIAWGATFDPDLVERMAASIGRDMAALGIHQGLSPVLDVVRDYRWGRVEETMGEDPYLVSVLGTAYVRGLQGAGVIATLKHFAGYSASRAARNHGPVPMGRRELIDVILPPFEMAVRLGDVGSVMNSYSDVDGVPAGADPWLLTEVLRDTWGFEGTVVSDYWAVPFLTSMHGVAADMDGAGVLALQAGIDVELPDTLGFSQQLVERVANGELDEALVDRAARRVLLQKIRLGLLDPDWTPEASVDPRRAGAARLDGQPRPRPRDGRAQHRPARRRHGPAAHGRGSHRAGDGRSRGSGRGRSAHLHGLLRLPQPRPPALPLPRSRHRGAQPRRRAGRRAARRPARPGAGLRNERRRPVRLRRGRRGGSPGRRLRRGRR